MCFAAVVGATNSDLTDLYSEMKKGDIIKLKSYCQKKIDESKSKESMEDKKKLLESILDRNKSKRKSNPIMDEPSSKIAKNSKRASSSATSKKVQIGWLHYDVYDKCFKSVRQAKGGGVRDMTLPLTSTKDDIIQVAKECFFPSGKSTFGTEDSMYFSLANFHKEEIDSSSTSSPFTLDWYLQSTKLTRLKLFLTSKEVQDENTCEISGSDIEGTDDEDMLLASVFEHDQSSKVQSVVSPKHDQMKQPKLPIFDDDIVNLESDDDTSLKQESGLLIQTTEASGGFDLQETRKLKESQDRAYQESLLKDQDKAQEMKYTAMLESQKALEQERLQQVRLLRVPDEPLQRENSVLIKVRHLTLGLVKRNFHQRNSMSNVYDWVGSLSPVPMNFELIDYSGKSCLPEQGVKMFEQCTLNMTETDSSPPLQGGDEVSFKGFSANNDHSGTGDGDETFKDEINAEPR